VKTPKRYLRLGLRILAIPVVHGELLGYSEVCLIDEEDNYILVDTFKISPTDTVFLLAFVSKSCRYSPALSGKQKLACVFVCQSQLQISREHRQVKTFILTSACSL